MRFLYFLPLLATLNIMWMLPGAVLGANKVITHRVDQPFSGSQSPDDAYIAALTKAKIEVLERAGTYLESLTVVENAVLSRDEVTALAGGILKTEVIKTENYATDVSFGILLTTKIEVDSDFLRQRMDTLLRDRTLLRKYNEIREREQALLEKIRMLEKENENLAGATLHSPNISNKFSQISSALTASEWVKKTLELWRDGRFHQAEKAIEYLSQAIVLDASNPATFNSRGVAYLNMGNYQKAKNDLNTALQLNPGYTDGYNNLGSVHYREGEYEKAIVAYTQALDHQPDFIEAILNRGMASRKLFNFEDAFEDFRKAMILAPTTFDRENDQGTLVELNDIKKMCEKAHVACEMDLCNSLTFLQSRGFCLQKQKTGN